VPLADLYPCGGRDFPPTIRQRLARIGQLVAQGDRSSASVQQEVAQLGDGAAGAFASGELTAACAGEAVAIARRLIGS